MSSFPKVRKAVLPVAGLGTRFLPATKAMAKEMLTVVDKPVIQYAVEEAIEAGIDEFIFVTGRGKSALEDHFDNPYELVDTLKKKGKEELLAKVLAVKPPHVRISYTRQGVPLGLGHAIGCAASLVGNEPFAVLLPDDIICTRSGNALRSMMETYNETGKSVVLAEEVPQDRISSYGIIDLNGAQPVAGKAEVHGFVEKPAPEEAPSNLGVVGRYIFTPRIMALLKDAKPGKGGEIQVTDSMDVLRQEEGFMAYSFDGCRFDCGDKVGWQQANLYFALKDDYIRERLLPYVKNLLAEIEAS